jgi:hypothetical protein
MLVGDIRHDEKIKTPSTQLLAYRCEPLVIF